MKTFALARDKTYLALLFDVDSTLYSNDEYAQSQIDLPIKKLAQVRGKTYEQMKAQVADFRKEWAQTHNGASVSLGNIFLALGVPIEESIKWREELDKPEDYLCKDSNLRRALLELSSRFALAVVTNNPVSVAVRTLSTLGVYDILNKIVGLDTCFISKPDKKILYKAMELCGVTPQQCISIGDRYDIDISLPLELGMGGILVDGVEDVYKLPSLLK